MKYVAKSKEGNRFKGVDCIADFDVNEFEKFDLYEVKKIDVRQYHEIVKRDKINQLQGQLKDLGVDINAIVQQQVQAALQNQTKGGSEVSSFSDEETSESPLLEADISLTQQVNNVEEKEAQKDISKVKKKSGEFFSMDELQKLFVTFQAEIETQMPELMFSAWDENGFTLHMSEEVNTLPKILPNGIPLKQVIG